MVRVCAVSGAQFVRRCTALTEGARPRRPCAHFDVAGLTPYATALAWQRELLRRRTAAPPPPVAGAPYPRPLDDVVFFLEHAPVYTLGRAASEAHLRFDRSSAAGGADVHRVERGGKVTYHGPGQLVVYPVLHLDRFRRDLHWYVHSVEEVVVGALGDFGLTAHRATGLPGVWVGDRKIAQVGMNCSKWVTSHGFAVNVDPDMGYFARIVPCGIEDRAVTSMALELARDGRPAPPMSAVRAAVARHFEARFDTALLPARGDPLEHDEREG